ncbi:Uncharacterized protein SCF082_LOCUS7550 [Durusdinium trenchii]|uniref:C3H1-type domain-containing protein n=1 Tax=Durusdinium trenchii TaxID=1381693 RepID=A0ABP0IK51_9DINO
MAPLSGLSGSSRVLAADPVVGAPKKPRLNCAATPVHSLQSAEEKERSKWADRLRIIAGKAGAHAEINRCVLGGDASARDERALRSLVFQTGAFRTIRQNVLVWEKMERWALDHSCTVYPLTTEVFTRYCVWLENQSCGPAVIPALTYAVGALIEKVYTDRGKELKEAPPVPMPVVLALEHLVEVLISEGKIPAAVFVWWAQILIYASLRWDDGRAEKKGHEICRAVLLSLWCAMARARLVEDQPEVVEPEIPEFVVRSTLPSKVRKEAESQSDKVEHVDKSAASPSKKKRKRQIERLREQLKQSSAKGAKVDRPTPPDKDKRIPSSEWQSITTAAQSVKGAKRCHYFNSSMGCSMGDKCRFKHACMKCGAAHPMVGNH